MKIFKTQQQPDIFFNRSGLLIIFSFFIINIVHGQNLPPRPSTLVNDYVGILSKPEITKLEQKLVAFNDSTSTQIAVIIVGDLLGYAPADYAQRIGEEWGVGQKEFDNGIVILVKPTGGQGQRKAFIAPGYGLEEVIPDLIAKRIVDNELIPNFRNGDFYKGLDKATNVIMSLAVGEYSADEYQEKTKDSIWGFILPILFIAIIFIIIRTSSARSYSKVNDIPFWTAFWLLSSTSSRHHSGSWGNFSSGSGGFGGFGGFGGGSFGGGGAGGSW